MTSKPPISTKTRRERRAYSADFKAQIIHACHQPGASIAAIAQDNDVNSNVLHRWLREQSLSREQDSLRTPAFVALPLAPTVAPGPVASPVTPAPTQASPSQDLIRVEIQRAGATVTMQWPVSAAAQCAQMLRELLR